MNIFKNLYLLIVFSSLFFASNTISQEVILTDEQNKMLRTTSQLILKGRLAQKNESTEIQAELRNSLSALQNIISDINKLAVSNSMELDNQSSFPNEITEGEINLLPQKKVAFSYDSSTGKIIEKESVESTVKVNSEKSTVVEKKLTRSNENKNNKKMKEINHSIETFKTMIKPKPSEVSEAKSVSLWAKAKQVLGFSSQKSQTTIQFSKIDPQQKLLALAEESQLILKALENNEAGALQRAKELQKRVTLTKGSTHLPDVQPTFINRTKHIPNYK